MADILKNIDGKKLMTLANEIEHASEEVVIVTLVENEAVGINLYSFPDNELICYPAQNGDTLITCLSGQGEITLGGILFEISEGQSIVMPAKIPNAIRGIKDFKIQHTVVFQ